MEKKEGFNIIVSERSVQLKAVGHTLKELFRNAVRGLTLYIKPEAEALSKKEKKEKHVLAVQAVDINSLLIEFLTQVIAQADFHGLVFTNATFKRFGDNFLEAELMGIPAGSFEREVKAVSYFDVDIIKDPVSGLYETMLIFEV